MNECVKQAEERMQKTISVFVNELTMIRAGRANPKLLDKIQVSYYGSLSPLQQVANVSVPEARVIAIQPWDRTLVKEINKAILASDIGITPQDDGQVIRLVFPELTGERRQELSKDVKKKNEEAKVAIRNIRRDAMDEIKKQEKNSLITEDDRKNDENELQKLTDRYCQNADTEAEKKIKEIMTV